MTLSTRTASAARAGRSLQPLTSLAAALLATLSVLLLALAPQCAAQSSTLLGNDVPVFGSLAANATAYFAFAPSAVSYQQTTLISVAASTGSPSLYVSLSNPTPSASSFNYSASWQTGGVVSIVSTQPPYTAYVAVQASPYSRCNFTVLVTAYNSATNQTTPVALSNGQPVASAIAASEYRYFTFTVAAGVNITTVALTEFYGQSFLLINPPSITALPTLSTAVYISSSVGFPLLALQMPVAGVWTAGVYSSAASAFTIIAADSASTQAVELGVTYPGFVPAASWAYYSVSLDQLQGQAGGNLDIELYSLSGDADLYISPTMPPAQYNHLWQSTNTLAEDSVTIPISQLLNYTTLYCGVVGYFASDYVFHVSTSVPGVLTPGETLTVESPSEGSAYYSMVFPATGPTFVTLSVESMLGTTQVYVNGAGQLPSRYNSIAIGWDSESQALQIYSPLLCGLNNGNTLPGSSPPLCQMQVLVSTTSAAAYSMVATVGSEVVTLVPGQPIAGVVNNAQAALLSFSMPDALSNVTLSITVTNGVSGLSLAVSKLVSYGGTTPSPQWFGQQLPGSNTLVFQLAYSDPILANWYSGKGEYLVTLSTASNTSVEYSVVYTVTNGSSYSIVELQDGAPQQSALSANAFDFYAFIPPAAGWPYTVTFSVIWLSGYGTLRATSGSSKQLGPLAADNGYANPSQISLSPGDYLSCNPLVSSSCLYSVSVQAANGLVEPAQYQIVAVAGPIVRALYADQPYYETGYLDVNNTDRWTSTLGISGTALNPNLMYSLWVTEGSLTVTITAAALSLNTSSSQMTRYNVSSWALLVLPVLRQEVLVTAQVSVLCTNTDPLRQCTYGILMEKTDKRTNQIDYYEQQVGLQPVNVLVPPNSIQYVGYYLNSYRTTSYIVVQTQVVIGSPVLYASCINYNTQGPYTAPLPDVTAATWTSTPVAAGGSPSIELYGFNATAANCSMIVVGVRGADGGAVQAYVSVQAANTLQTVYNENPTAGILTPQAPTNYFRFVVSGVMDAVTVLSVLVAPDTAYSQGSLSVPSCDVSQLQLAVSDTVASPDPTNPATYNFSAQPIALSSNVTDLSLHVTKFSQPTGSLHSGVYWMAVRGTVTSACKFWLTPQVYHSEVYLNAGPQQFSVGGPQFPIVMQFMPYNTSVSLGLQLFGQRGSFSLYVGVGTTPSLSDPTSYVLVAAYNTSLQATVAQYTAPSIWVPASACSSPTAVGAPCSVVLLAVQPFQPQGVYGAAFTLSPSSSNNLTTLLPGQAATQLGGRTQSSLIASYAFSLPASPQLVTLSFNTTAALDVYCSYQYFKPDYYTNEWTLRTPYGVNGPTAVYFTWAAGATANAPTQLVNANTAAPAVATTCYCTVQTAYYFANWTVSFSATPISPAAPPAVSSSSSSSSSSFSTPSSSVSSSPSSSSASYGASSSTSAPASTAGFLSSSSVSSSTPSTSPSSSSSYPSLSPTSTVVSPSTASAPSSTSTTLSVSSSVVSPSSSAVLPSSASALSSSSSSYSASSTASFGDNGGGSSLSSGALAAAVAVPVVVVVVLLLAALLFCWLRVRGRSASPTAKKAAQQRFDGSSEGEVSMTELGRSARASKNGSLISGELSSD